jgi:hypothetical protein
MPGTALPIPNAAMSRRQRWTMFVSSTGGALETFDIVAYASVVEAHVGVSHVGLSAHQCGRAGAHQRTH